LKALYAYPDHEVISDLIPGISDSWLPTAEAIETIRATSGLVPLAIDPTGGGRVYWADIGATPFREWQYTYTIARLAEAGEIRRYFSTSMDVLLADGLIPDPVPVAGFVFHVSRCGSTLMGKALARHPDHIVINQGSPLQRGYWAYITDDWRREAAATSDNIKILQNLMAAMTRRRVGSERLAFVKFISWNVLYADFIKRAFPDVPSLFMYRDPVEVIASVMRETTAVLEVKGHRQAGFLTGLPHEDTAAMGAVEYLAHCYANYFHHVLTPPKDVPYMHFLNYRDLNPSNFAKILRRGLGLVVEENAVAKMVEQFIYHSKDDSGKKVFADDSQDKQAVLSSLDRTVVDSICRDALRALDQDPRNLYPPQNFENKQDVRETVE
jgi:hypothetical protein